MKRDDWRAIQFVLGTPRDGIPGPKDDAALAELRAASVSEYQASKEISPEELGFMDGSAIVRRWDGVIEFWGGLTVNGDGSPHCYHPHGKGLDFLANAGKPGNWWGIATNEAGRPFVQGPDDPAPGFYVSTTSLQNSVYPVSDPRRYVDSEKVPFIVLPSNFPVKVKLGTRCRVTDVQKGVSSEAIYADVGPRFQLGEGSIALAKALGINPDPMKGGTERKLKYEILPD